MNEKVAKLRGSMQQRIVGKEQVIDRLIVSLLAGGHVLLEDVPGVGKTSLAKALSDSLSLSFSRIQCTPDTTPSDITGFSVYDQGTSSFKVLPGPIVNNIVLADELNRTSPKTQSALLEVMEEHRVTIDGNQIPVPEPFMVIATQNPSEMAGTYPIPESQMDRFMMKLSVGYPDTQASVDMAGRFLEGQLHGRIEPVLSAEDILDMRKEAQKVTVADSLRLYAVNIVEATRKNADIACGASPRALLAMLRCSQAIAYMDDRDYCVPEDIAKAAALSLPHRLVLTTEAKMNRVTKDHLITLIIERVKVS